MKKRYFWRLFFKPPYRIPTLMKLNSRDVFEKSTLENSRIVISRRIARFNRFLHGSNFETESWTAGR